MKKKKLILERRTIAQLTPTRLRQVHAGNQPPPECEPTTGDIMTILLSRNICTDG